MSDMELADEIVRLVKKLNKAIIEAAEQDIRVRVIGGRYVNLREIVKVDPLWEPKKLP